MKIIDPEKIFPAGFGSNLIMDSAVTLFPHPDSPTMPVVFPSAREKEILFTALKSSDSDRKPVLRLLTSSNFTGSLRTDRILAP